MTTVNAMFVREDQGEIAVVRMAHGKVSALDLEFCTAMADEINRLEQGDVRAVVLTGTGSVFSAGVDLFRLLDGGVEYVRQFLPAMDRFFRALLIAPKPVVAAVNGHAIAGGCIIAAAADYRLMARGQGRIGVPELVVGVPFPALPLEIVSARVSPALLRMLVYTGRAVEADEAVTVGFADEATKADQLAERAIEVAQQLSAIPSPTFRLTKRALVKPIIDRVNATDDQQVVEAWRSGLVHDAIRRYLDKTIKKKGLPH
jgi:enoyl-CoA hydratase